MVEDSKRFDAVLERRSVPEMRSNLEYRIIQAAKAGKKAHQQRGIWAGINAAIDEFFDGLLLPAPAYSLAFVLLVALFLGFYNDNALIMPDIAGVNDMADYMDFTQNSDFGDIL